MGWSRKRKWTTAVLLPVALLGLIEIAMRNPPDGTIVFARHPEPIVQYALSPGEHDIEGHGNLGMFHVSVNSVGMRDKEIEPSKPDGTIRVAAMGDSFTYGYGVEEEHSYVRQLERALDERLDTPIEILNFGVPGYNIVQEVKRLEVDGLAYAPDIVLLGIVDNDLLPRMPILGPGDDPSLLAQSMIGRFILRRKEEPAETPLSRQQNLDALRHLSTLAQTHGFEVVLATLIPPFSPGMDTLRGHVRHFKSLAQQPGRETANSVAAELGFTLIGPADELESNPVFASDGHPTVDGHRIIGEHIAEGFISAGLPTP